MIKRFFDLVCACIVTTIFLLPMLVIAILVKMSSSGPMLYWSKRVGKNNVVFNMPKFRSMRIETPEIATDCLVNPEEWVTSVGRLLRKSSLDELPQLWSIIIGDMSFVGPRPALTSQVDLIRLRTLIGVHTLKPGLTGWAQINGRDLLSLEQKLRYDQEYLNRNSFIFDLKIILLTLSCVLHYNRIKH